MKLLYLNNDTRPLYISSTVLIIIVVFIDTSSCCEQDLTPLNDECVCPGNLLQLTCTVVGRGTTVWRVEGQCTRAIELPHLEFTLPDGVTRRCNDAADAPTGRSISVIGECYTSLLTVMVTPNLNGTSIGCEHDNGINVESIGIHLITLTSEPLPPPDDVHLTSITFEGLVFSWSSVSPNCSAITYSISSDGCGDCPVNTTSTTVTCRELQLTANVQTCELSVQTIVCDKIGSIHSNPLITTLPPAMELTPTVKIIPKYQQNTTRLISFMIIIDKIASIPISEVNIAIVYFTVKYLIGGSVCESRMIELNDQACTGDACNVTSVISNSNCTVEADSDITVTVSATSGLGTGQESQSKFDGTYINFVSVTHETNRIICTFVNQQDRSRKSCNATYAPCDGVQQPQIAYNDTSESRLVLNLMLSDLQTKYCYTVNASNDTVSVLIDGTITRTTAQPSRKSVLQPRGIVGIVISILVMILILVLVAVILLCICWNSRKKELPMHKALYYHLKATNPLDSKRQEHESNHDEPDRESEDKSSRDSAQQTTADAQIIDSEANPSVSEPFQDTHPIPLEEDRGPREQVLKEVPPERFLWLSVKDDCQLLTFIESQKHPHQNKKLVFHRGNAFYEFSHKSEDIKGKTEVILMDVDTKKLYTGEQTKTMLGAPGKGIVNPYADKKKWRVFVQSSCTGNRHLDKDTMVLYEDLTSVKIEDFYCFKVGVDCELRTFVEQELQRIHAHNTTYKEGNAYFQFTCATEDIVDEKKEVLLLDKKGKLFTGPAAKYMIGAPGSEIPKPGPDFKYKVFLQNRSRGSRCLIKGTVLYYKKR